MKYRIEFTGSQLKAIRSIIVAHQTCLDRVDSYVDCSVDPAVETRPEELLMLFMTARPVRDA
jgi:hypothetical protein